MRILQNQSVSPNGSSNLHPGAIFANHVKSFFGNVAIMKSLAILFVFFLVSVSAGAQTITTVAGNGTDSYSGDAGLATDAGLRSPNDVALDVAGNLYIADSVNNRIRKVSPGGIITTYAGTGNAGFSGDGGLAINANLYGPTSIAIDAAGNLFFIDSNNNRVRKIAADGIITTIAGSSSTGYSGDGGPASAALLYYPKDIALDASGNLYIADTTNRVVRKVSTNGVIQTIAGIGGSFGFSGDGGPATSAQFKSPGSVTVDASGNIYILDYLDNRVRKVDSGGVITTVAGNGESNITGDGGAATSAAIYLPRSIEIERDGSFLISGDDHHIRRVNTAGVINTIAGYGLPGFSGDGGPPLDARLTMPRGMAIGTAGEIYLVDWGNKRIRKITNVIPGAPTITGTTPGNNQMRISIGAPASDGGTSITGYQVITNPAVGTDVNAGSNNPSHLVTGLSNGVNYTFTVTATNAVGTGPASAPSGSSTPGNVPSPPLSINATAGPNKAVVTFVTPVSNGGLPITGYRVASSPALPGDSQDLQAGTTALSRTIINLNKTTTYTFTVYAVNAAGESVASISSNAVTTPDTPSVPSAPVAVMSGNQVQISFPSSASNGGSPITGYRVTSVPDKIYDLQLATTRTITVPPGTYRFYVQAVNAVGSSAHSAASNVLVVKTVPDAPMISAAAPGNKTASIVIAPPWNDGGSPITGYTVISTPSGGVDSAAGTTSLKRIITGLTNGAAYTFKVRATNTIGTGPLSASSSMIIPSSSAQAYLWVSDTQVVEGNSGTKTVAFTISLSKPVGNAVTFDFYTGGGSSDSASPFTDFEFISLSGLSIPAGSVSTTVSVNVYGDTLYERNERFSANVAAVNGVFVLDGTGVGTILNDEPSISRIEAFVGMGADTFSGDGGPAAQAGIYSPQKMTMDNQGNFYFSDDTHHRIRKVNPNGIISTIAGNGTQGFSGDGGPAIQAMINQPSGIAADANGNVYFSDTGNIRVRKIAPNGIITTIAGNGNNSSLGDGGPATAATLEGAYGLAMHADGRLFIGEQNKVRVIGTDGVISRYAGNYSGTACFGALGDGGSALNASVCQIVDLAFDKSGNLFISDYGHIRVRKITPEGTISTVAGNGSTLSAGDGVPATSTGLSYASGVALDDAGNLYISESQNYRVRKVSPDGIISTIAGDGSPNYNGDGMDARLAGFASPSDVETDALGNIYVSAIWDHRIRKIISLVPGVPDNVVATAGNRQSTVTFSAPFAGDTPITGYTVRSIPAGGVDSNAGSSALSHVITGLNNGTAYTFVVTASSSGGSGAESQPSNSVIPFDAAVPILTINNASTTEGNSGAQVMSFSINLSIPALAGGVTFDLASSDARSIGNAARAGSDYSAINKTGVTIPQGASSATVDVKIVGDKLIEPDEIFTVKISNLLGAVPSGLEASGKIMNDDAASVTEATDSPPLQTGSGSSANSNSSNHADTNAPENSRVIAIHDIQGTQLISPLLGRNVVTEGIVTALRRDGFFLQAADNERDLDPATSEAVFVFTVTAPPNAATVGSRVEVSGRVNERTIGDSAHSLSLTQIISSNVRRISDRQPLPAAIQLTSSSWNAGSSYSWLECHEAMRISIPALTVVSPVGGSVDEANGTVSIDGVFYGVPAGVARPFREHGKTLLNPLAASDNAPVYDGNPERILVDSTAQKGAAALAVDAGDTVKGLIGVLDYAEEAYRLSPDPGKSFAVVSAASPRAAHTPAASDITIGEFNSGGLYNDVNDPKTNEPVMTASAYSLRLAKTANAVCAYAKSPDILGVAQVENLATLSDLAAAVNSRSGNILFPDACRSDPDYRPYLIKGNGLQASNIGFMVSTAEVRRGVPRVQVLSHLQFGKTAMFSHPDGKTESLYDQPPLMLKARVNHSDGQALQVTVLLVQWQGMLELGSAAPGENGWSTRGSYMRAKRQAQALALAKLIQAMQQTNPKEKLIVLGGFDAYEFGNGDDDLMALVTGKSSDAAANPQISPIRKPLVNMTLRAPKTERYSVTERGNAIATDHILVNQALIDSGYSAHIDYVRLNADFGTDNAGDNAVPMRVSGHDPLILHLGRSLQSLKKAVPPISQ